MTTQTNNSLLQNNFVRFALGTLAVLMVPFIGGWDWSTSDYVIMGTLVFGTGVAYELLVKKVGKQHRIIIGVVLLIAFALLWVELAVGIFGSPIAGN